MKKNEFIEKLRTELCGLPMEDIDRSVEFYGEIIDDKTEEGLTEEEAVAQLGSTESVVAQILSEIPLTKLVKNKIKSGHRLKVWEIVLLAVGSPIWVSLLASLVSVLLSLYATIWVLVLEQWQVSAALLAAW